MMPPSATRSSTGLRPGNRYRRADLGGSSVATRSHKSSGTRSTGTRCTLPKTLPVRHLPRRTHSETVSKRLIVRRGCRGSVVPGPRWPSSADSESLDSRCRGFVRISSVSGRLFDVEAVCREQFPLRRQITCNLSVPRIHGKFPVGRTRFGRYRRWHRVHQRSWTLVRVAESGRCRVKRTSTRFIVIRITSGCDANSRLFRFGAANRAGGICRRRQEAEGVRKVCALKLWPMSPIDPLSVPGASQGRPTYAARPAVCAPLEGAAAAPRATTQAVTGRSEAGRLRSGTRLPPAPPRA